MPAVTPAPAPQRSPVELEVQRLRALLGERRFAEALAGADALRRAVPGNRDVLYLRAIAQRHLGDTAAALATLAELERLHPRFSGLYQERGYCRVALRQAPEAIAAFLAGVNINPALPGSWSMLESLYRLTGQDANAAQAAAHVAALGRLPDEVRAATALFADGETGAAEELIRGFLLRHGHHVEAMRLLARIGVAREVYDDAQLLLEGVLALAPDYHAARLDYARVLAERHLYREALAQAEQLLAVNPADRDYRTFAALACVGLGQHERAIAIYRGLLAGATQPAELHLSIAHSLKTLGRGREALDEYHAAARARPGFGDAWWSLANLKTYRFAAAEIGEMRAAESSPATPGADRYQLCFALGKALEDERQYAESFGYYARGNALRRATGIYRPELHERNTRAQVEVCTRELFARHRHTGAPARDPIFIVGLPRSGSTLIEQILASHSAVEGTQELADIPRLAARLQGRDGAADGSRYPAVLAQLDPAEFLRLGENYLRDTQVYRSGKPRFIDKMPNNFRHLGLIHLMLPNAKIIDARREPMACCFGNFKQLFARGQEFAYGLEDLARYYRTYLELMRHWQAVLPGRILRVQHEDLVDDLDGNVRRILEYCELDFEPACVEFHKTERSVRTASSEQVRQPLYREGLEQWRHYEPWLGPLRAALGDAVTRYRE
ncbi:MAG: sulfotransferase [Gammaproteobacteria bacterium]|nr:sulfotransferase [Gammaproteobacteria bacterium]